MTQQIDRLDKSIAGMSEKLDTLSKTLTTNVARCEACRSVVIGNSRPPIDYRVTRLEEARRVKTSMILGTVMVVGAISSAIGAVVAVACS